MTKLLKLVALLILPFPVTYLVFGFIFWNWDIQSWGVGTRATYVWISSIFSAIMGQAVVDI